MKKFLLYISTIVILTLMVCPALAHPGGTDSRGGHTDHSTDEYHYHHGYSAHQHKDVDGDGDLDCPYDFIDKTGKTSGSNSTNYSENNGEQRFDPSNSLLFIFCIILLSIGLMFLPVGISEIKSRRKAKQERHKRGEE